MLPVVGPSLQFKKNSSWCGDIFNWRLASPGVAASFWALDSDTLHSLPSHLVFRAVRFEGEVSSLGQRFFDLVFALVRPMGIRNRSKRSPSTYVPSFFVLVPAPSFVFFSPRDFFWHPNLYRVCKGDMSTPRRISNDSCVPHLPYFACLLCLSY